MIVELLGNRHSLRILMALERKALRFTQIQKELALNPAQVSRALNLLRKGLWIIPRTAPTGKRPVRVEYSLGKRGEAFLESFKAFQAHAKTRQAELGHSEVAELQRLFE